MVRSAAKIGENQQRDAETEERRRLKTLAFSKKLLSGTSSKPISPLNPSKIILKHQGRDVVKKGQRKTKFLFSFPGLLAPVSGGKIGELKGLGTKNPILYLDFPQGRIKLFGTIAYPQNKYLTLQFGSKNVICEDSFESMVVFSDAWWIGKKDENPDEVKLEFPKEINEERHSEYDFKGGAGATSEDIPWINKPRRENVGQLSPEVETELTDDISEDSDLLNGKDVKEATEVTPVRQSARTAGKKFKFAESSSGDDSIDSDADKSVLNEKKVSDLDDSDIALFTPHPSQNDGDEVKFDLPKVGNSSARIESKEVSVYKRGALKQANIAKLFEKVDIKKSTCVRRSPAPKGSIEKQPTGSKQKPKHVKAEESSKKEILKREKRSGRTPTKRKYPQVRDDDIKDISSDSEDKKDSDEDWAA